MPREASSSAAPTGVRKTGRARSTLVACDNCRIKRLKCTYNERPCMNCKLYDKECQQTAGLSHSKAGVPTRQPHSHSHSHSGDVPSSVSLTTPNVVSNPPSLLLPVEHPGIPIPISSEGDWTPGPGIQEHVSHHHTTATATTTSSYPDSEQLQIPCAAENQLIASTEEQHHPQALQRQLDELFASEVLRSNIPFHDFSFLDDLMNDPCPDPLEMATDFSVPTGPGPGPIPSGNAPDQPDHSEQVETPRSKTTPISPFSQQGDKVSGLDSLQPDSGPQGSESHIPPGLFIGIEETKIGFLGLNSTGATLASCLRYSISKYPQLSSSLNFEWLVQAAKHIIKFDKDETVELSPAQLPPKSLAAMCVEAYFNNVHPHYPIVREGQFQTSCEALYDPSIPSHRVSNYILFCLVVTIGAASDRSNSTSSSSSPLDQFSRELFQKACALVYSPLTETSIVALQVMLLLILFLELNGQYSLASVLCGLSVRLCQTLGLHRRSPEDFDLAPDEVRYRSQLWWTTFRLETSVAMCEGRPTAVRELTYDVEILPLCHNHRVTPPTHNFSSAIHGWSALLTEHCNRFATINSLCTTTNARLDALTDLDSSLKRWRDQIPAAHQPGSDVVADWAAYMLVAPLHLEYFNLLRAVHWAFLMSAWTNIGTVDDRHRRSLRTSDMRCMSAARSFVQTLNSVADGGSGHSLFPIALHTDHYVNTAAVLFRSICENPQRMAAKADLEHLRAVRLHLERDSFSGEWSSTLRGTMGAMLQAAECLVRGEASSAGVVGISTGGTTVSSSGGGNGIDGADLAAAAEAKSF